MKYTITLFALLFLYGCSSKPNAENLATDSLLTQDSISNDTLPMEPQSETSSWEQLPELSLPLKIDSAMFIKAEDTLSYNAIRKTVLPLLAPYKGDTESNLVKAIEIDSLKRIGKYDAFVNALDIGQLAAAEAYLIGTCTVNGFKLVFWKTHYRTMDADPFAEGYNVFVTTFKDLKDAPISTAIVGSTIRGMDPPYFMQKSVTGILNQNGVFYLSVNGEEGEEDAVERIETDYKLTINQQGIISK